MLPQGQVGKKVPLFRANHLRVLRKVLRNLPGQHATLSHGLHHQSRKSVGAQVDSRIDLPASSKNRGVACSVVFRL
jgi:hypothetical protein